jgi:hypothetical protein
MSNPEDFSDWRDFLDGKNFSIKEITPGAHEISEYDEIEELPEGVGLTDYEGVTGFLEDNIEDCYDINIEVRYEGRQFVTIGITGRIEHHEEVPLSEGSSNNYEIVIIGPNSEYKFSEDSSDKIAELETC